MSKSTRTCQQKKGCIGETKPAFAPTSVWPPSTPAAFPSDFRHQITQRKLPCLPGPWSLHSPRQVQETKLLISSRAHDLPRIDMAGTEAKGRRSYPADDNRNNGRLRFYKHRSPQNRQNIRQLNLGTGQADACFFGAHPGSCAGLNFQDPHHPPELSP